MKEFYLLNERANALSMLTEDLNTTPMKKEYDFSKGERAKFYQADKEIYLPIYIEPKMMEALTRLSKAQGVEVATIVNECLRREIAAKLPMGKYPSS
jgi:hypothetical protein